MLSSSRFWSLPNPYHLKWEKNLYYKKMRGYFCFYKKIFYFNIYFKLFCGFRHYLRVQHLVEKEKLVLAVEQEILRVHGRAARALANQVGFYCWKSILPLVESINSIFYVLNIFSPCLFLCVLFCETKKCIIC